MGIKTVNSAKFKVMMRPSTEITQVKNFNYNVSAPKEDEHTMKAGAESVTFTFQHPSPVQGSPHIKSLQTEGIQA